MTTRNKIILGVVAALVVGVMVYLTIKLTKKTQANSSSGSVFPLKWDLRYNPVVKELQKKLNAKLSNVPQENLPLNKNGNPIVQLVEDGKFGDNTLKVVQFILKTDTVSEQQFNSL